METKKEQFQAVVRDVGRSDWLVMTEGSPETCRTKIVAEAGNMAVMGWRVRGMNRMQITVEDVVDGEIHRTEFRIRKVVNR